MLTGSNHQFRIYKSDRNFLEFFDQLEQVLFSYFFEKNDLIRRKNRENSVFVIWKLVDGSVEQDTGLKGMKCFKVQVFLEGHKNWTKSPG